eukprot:m.6654 g.6654  ORF g.6654 m.6654 type:complete len:1058 (-) comp2120_c0_seq1:291-3464(-)
MEHREDIICSGFLHKLCPLRTIVASLITAAGKSPRSTHRFFILRKSRACLDYYETHYPGAAQKGSINLLDVKRVRGNVAVAGSKHDPACTFALDTEDEVVYLIASSVELMNKWIQHLTAHIRFLAQAHSEGFTIAIRIHSVILPDIAAGARSAALQVTATCCDNTFTTPSRSSENLLWTDALYDFHASHLPTRVFFSVLERVGIFKPRAIAEAAMLLGPHTEPEGSMRVVSETGIEIAVSWIVRENQPLQMFHDTVFPSLAPPPPADVPPVPTYRLFLGTWNVGNRSPAAFSRADGLGWLDDAFASDIVAIGVQESFFRADREAADQGGTVRFVHRHSAPSMVLLAEAMRAAPSIATKIRPVKNTKKKCFSVRDAMQYLVRENLALDMPRANRLLEDMTSFGICSEASSEWWVWSPDEGPYSAAQWVERVAACKAVPAEMLVSGAAPPTNKTWPAILSELMQADFLEVASDKLLEMALAVFVHKRHGGKRIAVETSSEATGLAGVVPNKGGICVRLELDGLQFAFLSAHLAAHEDNEFVLARNSNVRNIFRGARVGVKELDVVMQSHHVFFMGDLNYRINLGIIQEPEARLVHYAKVHSLVKERQWGTLLSADQLREEQRNKRVFHQFCEGDIAFPPTFKVYRSPGTFYEQKRIPSYCDRVLYWSAPDRARDLALLAYRSAAKVDSSDHKPVYALFDIAGVAHPDFVRGLVMRSELDSTDEQGLLAEIGLRWLAVQGIQDSPDEKRRLYVVLFAPELLEDPSASVKGQLLHTAGSTLTASHRWEGATLPRLECKRVPSSEHLACRHVVVAVYEQTLAVEKVKVLRSQQIGACVLPVRPAMAGPWEFKAEILKYGLPVGVVCGELFVTIGDAVSSSASSKSAPLMPEITVDPDADDVTDVPLRPRDESAYISVFSRRSMIVASDDEDEAGKETNPAGSIDEDPLESSGSAAGTPADAATATLRLVRGRSAIQHGGGSIAAVIDPDISPEMSTLSTESSPNQAFDSSPEKAASDSSPEKASASDVSAAADAGDPDGIDDLPACVLQRGAARRVRKVSHA